MTEMKLKFQVELAPDEARSKILKAFEGAFQRSAAACNACHLAAAKGFIQISPIPGKQVPDLEPSTQ